MARTINEIQQQVTEVMVSELAAAGVIIDPATWSKTNIFRLLSYVFAFVSNFLETLFDLHKTDVSAAISEMKPHTERWYANMAKLYQHGFALLPDSDKFDNTGKTDDEIAASLVVKYSAVVKQIDTYGHITLRIKSATDTGEDLGSLSEEQLNGVREYFSRVGDAGVALSIDSLPPDSLKMKWTVYYDPLILNAQGNRLDGSADNIIANSIKAYLKELPFNGTFVLQYVTDAVQAVDGVVICQIDSASSKYGDFDFSGIDTKIVPDSGYLRFTEDADLQINYVPQSPIK